MKNWILKKHLDNFDVIADEYLPFYKNYLEQKGILVNENFSKSDSFVNWNMYPKYYKFFHDYEGSEADIEKLLSKSILSQKNKITMDFGYNNPIIQMNADYFIKNWNDFIVGAQYESTVISDDGKAIMEFTKNYFLLSNFIIK